MNQPPYSPSRPPAHLPVLTEVIDEKPLVAASSVPEFPELPVLTPFPELPEVDLSFPPPAPTPVVPSAAEVLAEQLDNMATRVRANVQLQVDQLLEARLREAMAPLLAQQADMLVFRLKMELASMLDDMVARAVSQEVHRQSLE